MSAPCPHLANVPLVTMTEGGCTDCIAVGDTWVHLRYCVGCGSIGCCDSSKNRHARKHWELTGHGVVRSKEPQEYWAYCYPDDEIVSTGTDGR
ncbi:MAG: UBP-type zinc finger domain-containing protein [Actinomycetia bacterium]|nr:UBP-type zinc finger domain-containing protein [Actinomycetes bacterium]